MLSTFNATRLLLMLSALSLMSERLVQAQVMGGWGLRKIGYMPADGLHARGAKGGLGAAGGVPAASFGGGTRIYLDGGNLFKGGVDAAAVTIYLESDEAWGSLVQSAPLRAATDVPDSDMDAGLLAYTLPPLAELFDLEELALDQLSSMSFYLYAWVPAAAKPNRASLPGLLGMGQVRTCHWRQMDRCRISFNRLFTPQLLSVSPPIVYQGLQVAFEYDPAHTAKHALGGDLPFEYASLGGARLDLDGFVDPTYTLGNHQVGRLWGRVTDQPAANETAAVLHTWAGGARLGKGCRHCTYAGECVIGVSTIPVVNSVSSNSGFLSGG